MPLRTRVLLVILVLAVAAGLAATFNRPLRASLSAPVSAADPPDIERAYRTEQDWLVSMILGAAADLSSYARHPGQGGQDVTVAVTSPRPGLANVDVTAGSARISGPVQLSPYLWAPMAYVPAVRGLLPAGATDAAGTPASWGVEMLRRLREPDTAVLQEESQRVSEALNAAPLDATLHEEAALVLTVFALKERAQKFHDVRLALCRMTAHLALASALRHDGAGRSLEGSVAESVLLAIVGRQMEAIAAMRAAAAQLPGDVARSWSNVVWLRATGDWRRVKFGPDLTVLEQLEYFFTLRNRMGGVATSTLLETFHPEPTGDWTRSIMDHFPGAAAGLVYAVPGVDAQLREAGAVLHALEGVSLDESALLDRLNDGSARPVVAGRVQVLDWGLWGPFFQRHLLWAGGQASHFQRWKPREEGQAIVHRVEPMIRRLLLFALLARGRAFDNPSYDEAMGAAVPLLARRAELVTPANWRLMLEKPAFAGTAWQVPIDTDWFAPPLPFGCVMDMTPRMMGPYCWRDVSPAQLQELRKIAPYDYSLAWHLVIEAYGRKATANEIRSVFGELLDYDAGALLGFAKLRKGSPEDYIPVATKLCSMEPDTCPTLAEYLADLGREEEAARVFEDYMGKAHDMVGLSNTVHWFVRYQLDMNRPDKALEVASLADDTGEWSGLVAKCEVLDRTGKLDEAQTCYRELEDRFDDGIHMLEFLLRNRGTAGGARLRQEASQRLQAVFGGEPLRGSAATLSGQPKAGLKVTDVGFTARKAGLRVDDIVVALDGVLVRNVSQFRVAWVLRWSPDVVVTVWRHGGYADIRVHTPQRWLEWETRNLEGETEQ
jgi:hypothetical protein